MTRPEWMDDAELAETYLREHARPGQPAALMLAADEPPDPEHWRAIVGWLVDRGWTTVVIDGDLWLTPPELAAPTAVERALN
jgi:hypothetical protein